MPPAGEGGGAAYGVRGRPRHVESQGPAEQVLDGPLFPVVTQTAKKTRDVSGTETLVPFVVSVRTMFQ